MAAFRQFVLSTHQWLGLGSSAILAVAGGTGAVMVWGNLRFPGRWILGALHDSLGLGSIGHMVVLIATAGAVALQLGGLFLWWPRKEFRIRPRAGAWRLAVDLHNIVGVVGFVLMLVIASSAVVRGAARMLDDAEGFPSVRQTMFALHTGKPYPRPVKIAYSLASAAFAAQGITGMAMWWHSTGRILARTAWRKERP